MGRTRTSEADPLGREKKRVGRGARGGAGGPPRTGFDGPTNAPWRKTVSIFKQPVTLVQTTSRESRKAPPEQLKKAEQLKRTSQEKPQQLLWAKALEGMCAMLPIESAEKVPQGDFVEERLCIPEKLEAACEVLDDVATAASVCSALHNPVPHPVTGQTASRKLVSADPFLHINPEQPHILTVTVSDQDILAQERRVLDARKRLLEVRKHFG